MNYLKIFTDFRETTKRLKDAEFGRLVRAMLEYVETGKEPELSGNELFLWDGAKLGIDKQKSTYDNKVKAMETARTSNPNNNSLLLVTDSFDAKQNSLKQKTVQEKEKEENKEKDKDNHNHNMTMMTPPNELAAESNDLATVYQAWDKASGRIVSLAEQEELIALLDEYGREPMLAAIRQCTLHNAVSLSYLGAVLRGPKEKPNTKPEIDAKWL